MMLVECDPKTGEELSRTEISGVSEEELESYRRRLFCSCKEPDSEPEYREGHLGVNHGWVCRKCDKFVQIG